MPIHCWETGILSREGGSNMPTLHDFVWAEPFDILSWLHKFFIFNIGSINCRIPPCPSIPKIRFFFDCFFFLVIVNVWSVILPQTQTNKVMVIDFVIKFALKQMSTKISILLLVVENIKKDKQMPDYVWNSNSWVFVCVWILEPLNAHCIQICGLFGRVGSLTAMKNFDQNHSCLRINVSIVMIIRLF